ncbi:MAG TPA: TonB family protein [Candidatus Nitrosotalea sp.]|nr:TonB family protein [Candidatus Nitrosotalea sp.]
MSEQTKSNVISIGDWQQLAGKQAAGLPVNKDRDAAGMEVPIRVLGQRVAGDAGGSQRQGEPFEEDSTTMLLFSRGAVFPLTAAVIRGQELMLINKRTNRYAHSRVTNIRTSEDARYIEIEFTHSIPDFWGISNVGDAARAVSVVTSYAAQMSVEPASNDQVEPAPSAPARALAAVASAGPACPGTATFFSHSTTAPLAISPEPAAESGGSCSAPTVFIPRPMEAIPVSEPVIDPLDKHASAVVEAVPPLLAPVCEVISAAEPKRKRRPRRTLIVAAALGAVVLGYRFYSPAEAALPIDAPVTLVQTTETAPANQPAASESADTPSGIVVTASEPEMEIKEAPQQRVVLVSSMNMPEKQAAARAGDAPEVTTPVGDQPAAVPGRSPALFGALNAAPPPPPQEEPPKTAEKPAEPLPLIPARLLTSVRPIYPPAARQAQIQGSVILEIQIDAFGSVTESKVISGPQALRTAATEAVAKWKYQPAMQGNRPSPSTSTVMVTFQLR